MMIPIGEETNDAQLREAGIDAVLSKPVEQVELFARLENLLDEEYETFGLIGEEPGEVDVPAFAEFDNPRFLGPGAPRAAFVGVKLSL